MWFSQLCSVQLFKHTAIFKHLAILPTMQSHGRPFTQEFQELFEGILKQNRLVKASNTIFQEAMTCLKNAKHGYLMQKVHPKMVFVHPKNRNGLGLSWHNAHRNGAKIKAVGGDVEELRNAYMMEMSTDPQMHAAQKAFNVKLYNRSCGLLAEPTGYERFMSLGCGHTAAFCRAAEAGCVTSQPTLQDAQGRIDKQKVYSDAVLKRMCTVGWDWWVLPAWVDMYFPSFADLAQKALNASNHVASLVGELEVAKSMADVMEDGGTDWELQAVAAVESVAAPAAAYCRVILKFVKNFAGGAGSPLLSFLDAVAKSFQCHAILGETFWTAVTDADFPTQSKNPLLRNALILTNLTSAKFQDGIARLLINKDVQKLCV